MTDAVQNNSIDKFSLQHGLLLGFIAIVLALVFYIIDPLLQYTNVWLGLLTLVIIIVLMVVLGLDIRKKIGGYWTFGQAFKSQLIMAVCITVMANIYNFIILTYVNPDLPTKANAAMLDKVTTSLTQSNVDQSKIDEYTKTFRDGEFIAKLQPTLKNMALAVCIGILLYGIIGLIIAASIKKKAPLYAAPVDDEPSV